MIEKLTKKQLASIPEIKKKWIDIALKPADREKAIKGVHWLYEFCGYKKPLVLFMDNPYDCQIAANLIKNGQIYEQIFQQIYERIDKQIRQRIRQQIDEQTNEQIQEQIDKQIPQQIEQQISQQTDRQINQQVRQQIDEQTNEQIRQQINQQVRQQINQQVRQQIHQRIHQRIFQQIYKQIPQQIEQRINEQIDRQTNEQKLSFFSFSCDEILWCAYWIAYFDFFQQNNLLKNVDWDNFNKYADAVSDVGMAIYLEDIAIISQKPEVRFENERVHSEIEPAIKFKGYELHYLKGVYFEKELWRKITSAELSAREAMEIKNAEQRAIAMSYVGFDRLKKECSVETKGKDQYGEIVELSIKDINGDLIRYFVGLDPAKNEKCYLLCPPDISEPNEFLTKHYNLDIFGLKYNPSVRT